MGSILIFLCFCIMLTLSEDYQYKDPHFFKGRKGIVQLFEWKFDDIANECKHFLPIYQFGGVQVSPITENVISKDRSWKERYEPISYLINTRSGNESQFNNMVNTCNKNGVRVYVDLVINHMSSSTETEVKGTAGSTANPQDQYYSAVGYNKEHFHHFPTMDNLTQMYYWKNVEKYKVNQLNDLDQTNEYVRTQIINLMNKVISKGVAGFRISYARYMDIKDLIYIYSNVNDLNTKHFQKNGLRPFIYHDVSRHESLGPYFINAIDYTPWSRVEDLYYSKTLSQYFKDLELILPDLSNCGPSYIANQCLNDEDSLVFVDNEFQRINTDGVNEFYKPPLTYKDEKLYKMAVGFMLARPLGVKRIMSSYKFRGKNEIPPYNDDFSIKDVEYNNDMTCKNGWVCEHRWRQIYSMNVFDSIVDGTVVEHRWDNKKRQIAFSRGNRGFIAFNGEYDEAMNSTIQTGLPEGTYCDIISGVLKDRKCTGKSLKVNKDGKTVVTIKQLNKLTKSDDGFIATHIKAKVENSNIFMNIMNLVYNSFEQMYN